LVFYKEIINSLTKEYKIIDFSFIDSINQGTGSYCMNNFREINIKFIEKIGLQKKRIYFTD